MPRNRKKRRRPRASSRQGHPRFSMRNYGAGQIARLGLARTGKGQ